MIEITKDNLGCANNVDKYYTKHKKSVFIKEILGESKILMYLLGAFLIFAVANATLIYSFFKILIKL